MGRLSALRERDMIQKILIANRGEITLRIARTCKEMGIGTVAVYSEADRFALHTVSCDEAIYIGPSPSSESYLVASSIIEAAKKMGADAIHPGYGFLAENADFAEACAQANLVFIGPSPDAIRIMGSKLESKTRMREVGVPTIPGTQGEGTELDALVAEAEGLTLPLLIKASAGGGGKGMRKVEDAKDLRKEMEIAAREAKKAFGDATLLVEHYVASPRHVEIQVFGDQHGNHVHLFERECSIQRRHQKVIEESPSVALTPELRKQMGEAAVKAAAAVNYVGAGTVEFILAPDGKFYFLEMNTRLQVEHPVTECVTGIDLVREQIQVAEGAPLSFSQDTLTLSGSALECRIYAEDPNNNFLPATGTLEDWHLPELPGIRLDSGVTAGNEVSIHYDPMLAKVIAWGPSRNEAIRRMRKALREFSIQGVTTNRAFLLDVLSHPNYLSGDIDTHFIDTHFSELDDAPAHISLTHYALAAICPSYLRQQTRTLLPTLLSGYRNNPFSLQTERFVGVEEGEEVVVRYRHDALRDYTVWVGDSELKVEDLEMDGPVVTGVFDGTRWSYRVIFRKGRTHVQCAQGTSTLVSIPRFPDPHASENEGSCLSPMPGKVVAVHVSAGDCVSKGDPVAAIEAMKMEHQVIAPADGTIREVLVQVGEQVDAQAPLVVLEPLEEESAKASA